MCDELNLYYYICLNDVKHPYVGLDQITARYKLSYCIVLYCIVKIAFCTLCQMEKYLTKGATNWSMKKHTKKSGHWLINGKRQGTTYW